MYKPNQLFLEITSECNLKCKQCHLWLTKEDYSKSLRTDEKLRLLNEFSAFSNNGSVILTGGETMMKTNEFFALTSRCRELKLYSVSNTNGTFLKGNLQEIVEIGPDAIVVSIDSHIPEKHDWIRGEHGLFNNLIDDIKELIKLKNIKVIYDRKVYVSTIIYEDNYKELSLIIEFFRSLGVDGITFQCLAPTFANNKKKDSFYKMNFFSDKKETKKALMEISKIYENDPFLLIKKKDWNYMCEYIDKPILSSKQICGAYKKNIVVDMYGEVYLCYNMLEIVDSSLGNFRKNNLVELITSEKSNKAKEIMKNCKPSCGLLNCNRV